MAKRKNDKAWMVPENDPDGHYTWHFVHSKTLNHARWNKKLRMRKYNPVTRQHEWFVEMKMPSHSKN